MASTSALNARIMHKNVYKPQNPFGRSNHGRQTVMRFLYELVFMPLFQNMRMRCEETKKLHKLYTIRNILYI